MSAGASNAKRSGSNTCFICAKAKRQQQSAQPERKSTTHHGDYPILGDNL
ncbi:hypothetical protein LAV73_13100 [Lysinibacillus xylanilyticus]|nr:hypothetical protein [Lysinibacillus xylanilyticus]MEB2280934.1 hypothetical protein [Lysinibacillus xylanilyticus]